MLSRFSSLPVLNPGSPYAFPSSYALRVAAVHAFAGRVEKGTRTLRRETGRKWVRTDRGRGD